MGVDTADSATTEKLGIASAILPMK